MNFSCVVQHLCCSAQLPRLATGLAAVTNGYSHRIVVIKLRRTSALLLVRADRPRPLALRRGHRESLKLLRSGQEAALDWRKCTKGGCNFPFCHGTSSFGSLADRAGMGTVTVQKSR